MSTPEQIDRRLSVAPMMEWTTRDFRYLCRLISKHTLLYTEMVTARAVINGDQDRLLGFDNIEHPVAVQLGGSEPELLTEAAKICESYGYDEINLNVGCPSERVKKGAFGACLMAEPELVAKCVQRMQDVVAIPVTVKSRIGIDDKDDYPFLYKFIETVKTSGCTSFTIHARKAILSGLSPKENREIPPLIYERAWQVKKDFPDLEVIINGGFKTMDEVVTQLQHVDGVMIGREAYQNPWCLSQADEKIFGQVSFDQSPLDVLNQYLQYVEKRFQEGHHPRFALRHVLSLPQSVPGARAFRRHLSENMHKDDATPEVLRQAIDLIQY